MVNTALRGRTKGVLVRGAASVNADLHPAPAGSPEDEIALWLEWASARLLALRISSPLPRQYLVSWPEYSADAGSAYGYTPNNLRAPIPSSVEIALMDELLLLPGLIPDVKIRRIVQARSLVTPVSNRHVNSWPKIALMLHTDRKAVARLYSKGLRVITENLAVRKADVLRRSFSALST